MKIITINLIYPKKLLQIIHKSDLMKSKANNIPILEIY